MFNFSIVQLLYWRQYWQLLILENVLKFIVMTSCFSTCIYTLTATHQRSVLMGHGPQPACLIPLQLGGLSRFGDLEMPKFLISSCHYQCWQKRERLVIGLFLLNSPWSTPQSAPPSEWDFFHWYPTYLLWFYTYRQFSLQYIFDLAVFKSVGLQQ